MKYALMFIRHAAGWKKKFKFCREIMLPQNLSQSVLTKQLREPENDGIVARKIYHEIPPKVEYSLTQIGEAFLPVITELGEWSEKHLMKQESGV